MKNIKPESPAIAVDTDTGKVTITPPAYKDPGDDTDLLSYTFTYNDASGAKQTGKVTRTVDGDGKTTWSSDCETVDAATGVVTLKVEDIKVGGTITATAKDKGGLEGDTEELESDPASKTLETVEVTYNAGDGGKGTMTDRKLKDGKILNKGAEYEILANAFTAPDNQKFKTWKIGNTEHKAKDKIRVKENTTIKAIWQDIEVKVSYSPNGGSGDMAGKTLKKGSKYTLLDSSFTAPDDTQEFKAWEVDGKEVAAGTEITVDKDTEVKAVWKKIQVNVTYDGNGGDGTMAGKTLDKGSKYTLLESTFTAPENKEFKGWKIGDTEYSAGDEITVNANTTVKAVWKDIMVDIDFDAGEGSGTMPKETVAKGSTFKLPDSKFEAPKNKEFKGWKIGVKEYQVGDKITVNGNTTITALWKDIEYKVNFDGNGGTGKMDEQTVKKGDSYKLPENGFTPPTGKEFNGWEIDGKTHKVGESITVDDDVTVKALWKDKPVPPSTTPGKDKPGNQAKTQPKPQKQNPAAGGNLSKTGANGIYSLYASLLLLATGGLFLIIRRRRNQR